MSLVETYNGDNLIAGIQHPAVGGTVVVASGEGELERGAVLARNESNEFELLDTASTGAAEVILASDVDATSASATAEVYVSGDFREEALVVGDSYEITENDRLNLKRAGIYLVAGVE